MMDVKVMTSSSLSPMPINVLSSECYGIWDHETLHPIATKLEVTDIMEFIDPSASSVLMHTSSSPSSTMSSMSSPASPSTTTAIMMSSSMNDSNANNNNDSASPNSNNQNSTTIILSDDHFHHHQVHPQQHDSSNNHNNHSSYSSSHYLTQLPSLNMMNSNDSYSPTEVQMLDSFNCIGNSDSVFHKLADGFTDYDGFLSEEQSCHTQEHLASEVSPPASHHHQHHQSQNGGQAHNALHNNLQLQHDHSTHNNASNANHMLGINSFQFSEPAILSHQTHVHQQHQHHQLHHHSSFHSNHEYNIWDDANNYLGEYKFVCKGESPTTSDSISYTSVDSGIDCSKSSSTESVSTSTFEIRNVTPPKRRVGRPPKKDKKLKRLGKEKKTGRLWEFIRDLLKNPEYCPSLVRWENPEEGHFRFVNSDQVAKLWGRLKGNPRMTYEKLSRAMRYYYKSHVFEPVLGRRLVYKFGFNATNWRPTNPNFSQKIFC